MNDISNLYPYGLPIYDPQWNVPQQLNHETEWLVRLVELETECDQWRQRAEAAERKLNDTLPQYVAQMATLLERAEAAESALAAVPVGAMKLVVWMLDDGPRDDVALAEVQRWIDACEESQP